MTADPNSVSGFVTRLVRAIDALTALEALDGGILPGEALGLIRETAAVLGEIQEEWQS